MQITGSSSYAQDPQLACTGDMGEEAAALAIEGGVETKLAERRIEQTENDIAEQEANQEIQAMKQKADALRSAGVLDGGVGAAAGALQAASAGWDLSAAGAGSSVAGNSLKVEGEWFKTASTGIEAGAKITDGLYQGKESADAITGRSAGQVADRASTAAKEAHDSSAAEQDTVNKALEFYGQYAQTQAATVLAVAQRV